jgi:hypothetical protein
MGRALRIRDDLTASGLRRRAAREKKTRVARRMPAIANALDGMGRARAARGRDGCWQARASSGSAVPVRRAAGMDRQALRDAVVR